MEPPRQTTVTTQLQQRSALRDSSSAWPCLTRVLRVSSLHKMRIMLLVTALVAAVCLAMVVFLYTNQSISTRSLQDGDVREEDLQDSSVSTQKVADSSITQSKLGANRYASDARASRMLHQKS